MGVLIFFSAFFGLMGFLKHRRLDNPLTVFSLLWGVIFFLFSLKLVDYFDISTHTEFVLLIQMIGFAVGCWISDGLRIRIKRNRDRGTAQLCRPLLYACIIITIVHLLSEVTSIIGYLSSGLTYFDIAHQQLGTENSATGLMVLVKIFIVFPTVYGISAIAASELFAGKKSWLLLLSNIAIVSLYALQHGGRHMVLILVISYLFAYANSNRHAQFNKKQQRWILLLCAAAVLFAVWLSAARGIDDLWMSLYHYFACCIPNLDQWISRLRSAGEYTYGFTSVNGFISPVVILLQGFGLIQGGPYLYRLANAQISAVEELMTIGYGVSTNAFVGISYSFYADGGMLFVLLGNCIFGFVCMRQYRCMRQRRDCKSTALYMILIASVCMSFTRFQYCQYFYAMAIVLINLLYRKGARAE